MNTFLLVVAVLIFYLLPALICTVRQTKHSGTIFWINLLLGWTVLGWIAALIWAIAEHTEARSAAGTGWSKPFYEN